jgi:predicted nicotinamide N-methyase
LNKKNYIRKVIHAKIFPNEGVSIGPPTCFPRRARRVTAGACAVRRLSPAYARAMTPETEALVRSATTWTAVPFVPEVTLLTAAEPFGLWDRTERDAPPFWAFPWAGGQGLARYVLDHPETVAGRAVLDVASGSGLVAIAAAKAGARSVLAGDIDDNALAAIALNAAANEVTAVLPRRTDLAVGPGDRAGCDGCADCAGCAGCADRAGCGDRAGCAGCADRGGCAGGADVVLAADVFYQRDLAGLALRFLLAARRRGADVLAADPGRAFVPRESLTALATYQVPVLTVLEDVPVKEVTVYRLR